MSGGRPARAARLRAISLAASTAFVGLVGPAAGATPPPGALSCVGCHPATAQGAVPSLRGRSAEAIAADMQAFRTGARPATVMDRIAKGFSDDETRAIANWLAAAQP